jgi:hypothetical protein
MGSQTLLFVGDDWRDQFARFQSIEYASPLSPHIVPVDRLDQARQDYAVAKVGLMKLEDGSIVRSLDQIDEAQLRAGVRYQRVWEPLNGAVPFEQWAAEKYGVRPLAIDEAPDLVGTHRWGWMRIDAAGKAIELVEREIPGTLDYFYFIRATDAFLLRPGAIGWDIDGDIDSNGVEVREGFAGAARLRDIDLDEMRRRNRAEFEAHWDAVQARTQGARWRPSAEFEQRAPREWSDQPAVRLAASTPGTRDATPSGIDPLLLPRDAYVAHHRRRTQALDYSEAVKNWQHLDWPEEEEILAGLGGDALLVSVTVKC